MRYEQPTVVVLGSAAELVQGQSNKPAQLSDNIVPGAQTSSAAYEVDE